VNRPIVIAHRTSPAYAPENSLEGVRVSFEQGADGVEIDVRMTLDMRPFLMHDNTMQRTTGWPLPIELTPSLVVRRRRLEGSNEAPPTLAQAIDAVPDGKLIAFDVKTPWSIFPLISEIRARGMAARSLVWCSSERVARYAAKRLPGVEVAYYKDYEDEPNNLAFIAKARRLGFQAVSLDWRGLTLGVVEAAHLEGLKVYSWHRGFEVTREKLETGLDGVITDHPRRTREAIEGMQVG
jgi:glycerophosphoryl diester phosphodiesterase